MSDVSKIFVTSRLIVARLSACRSLALSFVCTLADSVSISSFCRLVRQDSCGFFRVVWSAVVCSTSSSDGCGSSSLTGKMGRDLHHRCRQMWGNEVDTPSSNHRMCGSGLLFVPGYRCHQRTHLCFQIS